MIQSCFNSSPFEAINSAYPNRFKEWELPNVPSNFWNSKENCIKATIWLIEEKLKIDITTAKQKLSYKHFKDYNLLSLCAKYTLIEMLEEGSSADS